MQFTICLPNCMQVDAVTQPWERDLSGRDIATVAQRAEQLGYSMVFLPEHFLIPTAHVELSGNPLDSLEAYLDHMQWVAEEVVPKVG